MSLDLDNIPGGWAILGDGTPERPAPRTLAAISPDRPDVEESVGERPIWSLSDQSLSRTLSSEDTYNLKFGVAPDGRVVRVPKQFYDGGMWRSLSGVTDTLDVVWADFNREFSAQALTDAELAPGPCNALRPTGGLFWRDNGYAPEALRYMMRLVAAYWPATRAGSVGNPCSGIHQTSWLRELLSAGAQYSVQGPLTHMPEPCAMVESTYINNLGQEVPPSNVYVPGSLAIAGGTNFNVTPRGTTDPGPAYSRWSSVLAEVGVLKGEYKNLLNGVFLSGYQVGTHGARADSLLHWAQVLLGLSRAWRMLYGRSSAPGDLAKALSYELSAHVLGKWALWPLLEYAQIIVHELGHKFTFMTGLYDGVSAEIDGHVVEECCTCKVAATFKGAVIADLGLPPDREDGSNCLRTEVTLDDGCSSVANFTATGTFSSPCQVNGGVSVTFTGDCLE